MKVKQLVQKIVKWVVVQAKTKSWKRHAALLVITIPLILQKFDVGTDIIDMVNKWVAVLTSGAVDDSTLGTLFAGTAFYIFGWLKRKKT